MWPITHITDALGLLAYCFCGYAAFLVIVTVWKHRRPKHAAKWMKFLENARRSKRNIKGWAALNEMPIALVFSASCIALMLYGASRTKYPIASYHDVRIFPQNEYGDWPMSAKEDTSLVFHPCGDFDVKPMLKQAADEGWIAHSVKWEQRSTCQSIYDPSLGFTFNDEHFQYRRISNANASAK